MCGHRRAADNSLLPLAVNNINRLFCKFHAHNRLRIKFSVPFVFFSKKVWNRNEPVWRFDPNLNTEFGSFFGGQLPILPILRHNFRPFFFCNFYCLESWPTQCFFSSLCAIPNSISSFIALMCVNSHAFAETRR